MAKIKDLDKYLTSTTGLDKEERQVWRECIARLSAEGKREESFKVFQSFSYWKEKYQNK